MTYFENCQLEMEHTNVNKDTVNTHIADTLNQFLEAPEKYLPRPEYVDSSCFIEVK